MLPLLSSRGSHFRALAKTREWRERFYLSKQLGIPLFDGPMSDWNELQIELASACLYYYNIKYEIDSPPSEEIINDDYLLFEWLKRRKTDKMSEDRQRRLSNPDNKLSRRNSSLSNVQDLM